MNNASPSPDIGVPVIERLLKITNFDGKSRKKMRWGPNVIHYAPGGGRLCSAAWIHAYRQSPLVVAFIYPDDIPWKTPLLWEAEGIVGTYIGYLKEEVYYPETWMVGCFQLKTIRQIKLPRPSREQRVRFAIGCASRVCQDPEWTAWAQNWIDGTDRSIKSARAAAPAIANSASEKRLKIGRYGWGNASLEIRAAIEIATRTLTIGKDAATAAAWAAESIASRKPMVSTARSAARSGCKAVQIAAMDTPYAAAHAVDLEAIAQWAMTDAPLPAMESDT